MLLFIIFQVLGHTGVRALLEGERHHKGTATSQVAVVLYLILLIPEQAAGPTPDAE